MIVPTRTLREGLETEGYVAERDADAASGRTPPRLGVLFTYANSEEANARVLGVAHEYGLPAILDSGAWSVFNAGAKIDPRKQAEFVIRLTELYPEHRYLGLDVIDSEWDSLRNWRLQREMGARVEPTIHFGANPREWVRLYLDASFGDHPGLAAMPDGRAWINVGGLVAGQSNPKMHRKMAAWSAAIRREVDRFDPTIRIHGLGTTTPAVNDLVRFDGVDSSYWLVSLARFRTLPLFDPERRRWARTLHASTKPAYIRASKGDMYAMARLLRTYYNTSPAEVLAMDDDELLGLSLRSHAYFADTYRDRHRRVDAPIVYLAGAPTKADDALWEVIARWSHDGPLAASTGVD